MRETFTAGAERALARAAVQARARSADAVVPIDLLMALATDEESRAAALLADFGLDAATLRDDLDLPVPSADLVEEGEHPIPRSPELRAVVADALVLARGLDRDGSAGTEHLLVALAASEDHPAPVLAARGVTADALRARLESNQPAETAPLAFTDDLPPPRLRDPGELADLARIFDAAANRAREGLRVVEDYVRFVLDDPALTKRLKDIRHRLAEATRGHDPDLLLAARDTEGDVGTHIMTAAESSRESPRAVLTANLKRTAEALRTLEEYSKLDDPWLAGRFEVLRYDVYTLEKRVLTAATSFRALADARLYVLVGGEPTLGTLTWVVSEAIAGGAQVIQYREKGLDDRERLTRARELRIITAQAGVRFIVNDRPDLARLAGADGVHLGQGDVSVRDARRIVGPNALIGVSTHNENQLDAALRDGASYLGVGPVFPSGTKAFDDFAGLAFVRHAAETTTVPWFAIGGIDESNLEDVLEAGAARIAVSGSVVRAESPRQAAAALRSRLTPL